MSNKISTAYLGIGGNLPSRLFNIERAIELISDKITPPKNISSVYISEAWGFQHSKYFTNAVVELETDFTPIQILLKIKEIENEMKRIKTKDSYEGRTMDVDILFYGDEILNDENIKIPHPLLHERLFVLLPLNELASEFTHPVLKKNVAELLKNCNDKSKIRKLCYAPRKIHEIGNS